MSLEDELDAKVEEIFKSTWDNRDSERVPEPDDIGLGNDGVLLKAAVLYADLADSTDLVDTESQSFAAEIYKSYLHCAAKIIRSEKGEITAYDGDRIMAVFLGSKKHSHAARAALKINYVVKRIINPQLNECYNDNEYEVEHGIGIDASDILVARTGIRGSNDLVWVGRAANYAAKLCGLRKESYSIYITERVYRAMNDSVTFDSDGADMWEPRKWARNGKCVYRSLYHWGGA
jgi:class 3 adenylate cyclase